MRTLLAVVLITTTVFAGDTNAFRAFQVLSFTNRPALIESSKMASITNGITLGQLVTNLGPGWVRQTESVGIIRWSFSDSHELNVKPHSYSASDVLTTNTHAVSRYWFTTNAYITPSK